MTLLNLIVERLDIRLIGGQTGEKIFSVPVHTLHRDVADFIDVFLSILMHEIVPPDGRPFTKLVAKYQYNTFMASGMNPDQWDGESKTVPAEQVKGRSASELVDLYLRENALRKFFQYIVTRFNPA